VIGQVDALGNATYEIVEPVAWDEIPVSDQVLAEVAQAKGIVFGSLASRSRFNFEVLNRLLQVEGPMKFFDVNLRPPFGDPERILELAHNADVLKLNHDELALMASRLETGAGRSKAPEGLDKIREGCATIAKVTGAGQVCVTMAAEGAALWDGHNLYHATAPKVTVRDTVGAGDAFMAGLMVGLTNGTEAQSVLQAACRLGAFVASQNGATPILPESLRHEVRVQLGGLG
jgi:fructokinase